MRDVRRSSLLRVALKRPSDSGIFEGFSWSVQGSQNFRPANTGLGGADRMRQIVSVKRALRERSQGFGGKSALALVTLPYERRRSMLVIEQDAAESNVFPVPQTGRAFDQMPGLWRWETKEQAPSEPLKGYCRL
jgi:hypothetical protein